MAHCSFSISLEVGGEGAGLVEESSLVNPLLPQPTSVCLVAMDLNMDLGDTTAGPHGLGVLPPHVSIACLLLYILNRISPAIDKCGSVDKQDAGLGGTSYSHG